MTSSRPGIGQRRPGVGVIVDAWVRVFAGVRPERWRIKVGKGDNSAEPWVKVGPIRGEKRISGSSVMATGLDGEDKAAGKCRG